MKKYLLPAFVAVLILGGVFVAGNIHGRMHKSTGVAQTDEIKHREVIEFAHGRVLYVVVDNDGIYVGQEFIPFILFDKFLKEHGGELKPDYAIVYGTESSRFGRAVEAIDSIRANLKIKVTMVTRAVPDGTRRGPIEFHENFWEY
jgi:hypothetical protein